MTDLSAVWGSGAGDVWIGNLSGSLLRQDGAGNWSSVPSGTTQEIRGIWGTGPRHILAAGEGSSVLRRARACLAAEVSCGDGLDDDCDGLIDCADPDCAADPVCEVGGLCAGFQEITCAAGEVVTVAGTTAGGPSRIARYGCTPWHNAGREATYRLEGPVSGEITVSLDDLEKDLDLLVLAERAGGGCEPRIPGCLAAASAEQAEEPVSFVPAVTFAAEAGHAYYLVVDGYGINAGDFTLSVACP